LTLSPKTKAIVRQQALRRICSSGDSKLSKDARLIASYLRSFCNGDGRFGIPISQQTGTIDPLAMARAAGRREVFDLLARMMSITIEDRHNLGEEL
jgi:hypothetical protein